jgi:hypothetical protein
MDHRDPAGQATRMECGRVDVKTENYRIGDIVLLDMAENKAFTDCLMVVEEVKPWGLFGYVPCFES